MNLLKGTLWGILFVLVMGITPYLMILIRNYWDSPWSTFVSVILLLAGSFFASWIVIAKIAKYLEEEG